MEKGRIILIIGVILAAVAMIPQYFFGLFTTTVSNISQHVDLMVTPFGQLITTGSVNEVSFAENLVYTVPGVLLVTGVVLSLGSLRIQSLAKIAGIIIIAAPLLFLGSMLLEYLLNKDGSLVEIPLLGYKLYSTALVRFPLFGTGTSFFGSTITWYLSGGFFSSFVGGFFVMNSANK